MSESEATQRRMRVLLIAPYFDKNVPGESWCTYKWVQGISERCDVTVLSSHSKGWTSARSPIAAREIVNWTHPNLKGPLARIDYELKPHYVLFYLRARRWIKRKLKEGFPFDLVHQINPVAVRYPSPAAGLGIRYITGPHAGSLPTPEGFLSESSDKQWYRKLRNLDQWRIKNDPLLRRSFADASLVLGVAPYMREFLRPANTRRFEIMAETGPEILSGQAKTPSPASEPLRLLFVGRIIRTKGVIDAIRAVAIASKTANVTLDVLGAGEMLETCQDEATKLGISNIVRFHGRIPRERVYDFYRSSDVFLFPSFREPSGTVVFEALGFGLPLIASANGGPGYVVDETCGIVVKPGTPQQYAQDLAVAVVRLASDRALVATLSKGALQRIEEVASWEKRLDRLMELYREVGKVTQSAPTASIATT